MKNDNTDAPVQAPSGNKLLKTTLLAIVAAAVLLILVVLPAEYGIDPTGLGGALGLTAINEPVRTIEITDVIGGNETLREAEIPDFGEPVPLPNPAVFQGAAEPAQTRTMQVSIPAMSETEVKLVMEEAKVVTFSWAVDRDDVYVDFHGHDIAFGPEFFVRYEEQQEGSEGHGSLTAPFGGEHGWYWLNYNDFPVVITLEVTGYYDEIIDYGIF